MKMTMHLDLEMEPVSLRSAWLIRRACRPGRLSPISPSIIDLGVKAGVIEKSGSWFSYNSTRIGQGRDNVREFLKANPEMAGEIEKAVRKNSIKIADELLGSPEPDDGDE